MRSIEDRLEPETACDGIDIRNDWTKGQALLSVAISLKRIADAQAPDPESSVSIILTRKEREAMAELVKMQDISPGAVMRQGLRLYQMTILAAREGLAMGFFDGDGKRVDYPISEPMMRPSTEK